MSEHQMLSRIQGSEHVSRKQETTAGKGSSHGVSVLQLAKTNPGSLSRGDIIQLQRSIGNRAVVQLLSDARRTSSDEGQKPVQKKGNHTGLPDNLKSGVENLSGMSMDDVRVHYNSAGPAEVGAHAYTQGNNIHVGPGQERHLPHEAWHVVQQNQGRVQPTMQMKGVAVNDDAGLEQEADVMGQRALRTTAPSGERVQAARGGSSDVIQKKGFSADEVINALLNISFIKKKLDEQLRHRHHTKALDRSGKNPLIHHVRKVVDQYKAHFEGGETDSVVRQGMVMSIVVENVAKLVAMNVLNDPELAPEIAGKLMEVFKKDIEKKFKKMDKMKETVAFAQSFVRDDPISRLLHEEITMEEAIKEISRQSHELKRPAIEVFNLYKQKFEVEMATRNRTRVEKKEDKGDMGAYSIANASGELSGAYFSKLFGDVVTNPQWKDGGLEYNDKTKTVLDELKRAIETGIKPEGPQYEQIEGLTDKQSKHLAIIKEREQRDQGEVTTEGSVDERVAIKLKDIFNLDDMDKARWLRDQVKDKIEQMPLTITVNGVNWFGKKVPGGKDTMYRTGGSRRNTIKYSKLFNKFWTSGEVKFLGEYKGNRTINYNRFRRWKDNQETSRLGFTDQELPSFGALNMNWNSRSTDYVKQGEERERYGQNYYGDTHFLVKRANVKDRIVYTATDFGTPRRTAYAAFCDFILSRGGILPGKLNDKKAIDTAIHVVNSVLNLNFTIFKDVQNFEVQFFGAIDIANDVSDIYVAPTVPQKAKENAKKFCEKHGMGYKDIGEEMPKDIVPIRGNQQAVQIKKKIDEMW